MTKSKHFPWTQLQWEAELLFGLQAIQWQTDTMGRGHLGRWRNAHQIKSQYVLYCGSVFCTPLSKPATLFLVLSQGSFALHYQMHTICIPNTCYINICYLFLFCYELCRFIWAVPRDPDAGLIYLCSVPLPSNFLYDFWPKFLCTLAHNSQNRSKGSSWTRKIPLTLRRILNWTTES